MSPALYSAYGMVYWRELKGTRPPSKIGGRRTFDFGEDDIEIQGSPIYQQF